MMGLFFLVELGCTLFTVRAKQVYNLALQEKETNFQWSSSLAKKNRPTVQQWDDARVKYFSGLVTVPRKSTSDVKLSCIPVISNIHVTFS